MNKWINLLGTNISLLQGTFLKMIFLWFKVGYVSSLKGNLLQIYREVKIKD